MKLSCEELEQISDAAGNLKGWDFSHMRTACGPVPWDYPKIACRFIRRTDSVLDVGTGGGEIFLGLAPHFEKGIGIDQSRKMIEQARQNKADWGITNIDFDMMAANDLILPDARFDVVLNRHCYVDVRETVRVLRSKGYFITQQVACENTLNILEAFGWTFAIFRDGGSQPVDELSAEFKRAGCRIIGMAEYDVPYWFLDVDSLVFWLKAVPLPEPFDVHKHLDGVNRIINEYFTDRGIETNEQRELLIVQKL